MRKSVLLLSVALVLSVATTAFAAVPPFVCEKTTADIEVDGDISEWTNGVIYPLCFNQLNTKDYRGMGPDDLTAAYAVVYKGEWLYGYVLRQDDVTKINNSSPWENDCVELFINVDGTFNQLRSLVGKPLDKGSYSEVKGAWSEDGTVFEFGVKIPELESGKVLGWNIAVNDNDEGFREAQYYPINGYNRSWQNMDLGELELK